MATPDRFGVILWAPKFDEFLAVAFVVVLRAAGVRAKLVGLSIDWALGSHGLGLVPDLTIEQVLPPRNNISCIVIPCTSLHVRRLTRDPRVRELLVYAQINQILMSVSLGSDTILETMGLVDRNRSRLLIYTCDSTVLDSARDLVRTILPSYKETQPWGAHDTEHLP